jgi:hypothetical protein
LALRVLPCWGSNRYIAAAPTVPVTIAFFIGHLPLARLLAAFAARGRLWALVPLALLAAVHRPPE